MSMQQALINSQDSTDPHTSSTRSKTCQTTFQQCLKASQGRGLYNRKLFFLLAAHIIFASFFMALPFFLFKKPIYCEYVDPQTGDGSGCCEEGDEACVEEICGRYRGSIGSHVIREESLTYIFGLFCGKDWLRVAYKVFPETLSIIGFLVYGRLADVKGRKTALKISWRMYVVGIVMFSAAQSHLLKVLGYGLACMNCFPSLIMQLVLFFQHNIKKQKNRASLILLACLSVGPLILALSSQLITQLDNQLLLGILCAVPAFILALLDRQIHQSAVCLYKFDKAKAFGVLNLIAKQNEKEPILIDLSKSYWHKSGFPSTGFVALLRREKIGMKIVMGFFFIFMVTFNIRISQISLDTYTETQVRSVLVNVPTALGDLTLCIFLLKLKERTCRPLNILIALLLISLLVCLSLSLPQPTMKAITIPHAVLIRYFSELCDGLLLIWSIETFPTVCRSFCVCLVFCGSGCGVVAAYLLREQIEIAYVVGLGCVILGVLTEGFLGMEGFGVMRDTLEGGYYDEEDRFYRS